MIPLLIGAGLAVAGGGMNAMAERKKAKQLASDQTRLAVGRGMVADQNEQASWADLNENLGYSRENQDSVGRTLERLRAALAGSGGRQRSSRDASHAAMAGNHAVDPIAAVNPLEEQARGENAGRLNLYRTALADDVAMGAASTADDASLAQVDEGMRLDRGTLLDRYKWALLNQRMRGIRRSTDQERMMAALGQGMGSSQAAENMQLGGTLAGVGGSALMGYAGGKGRAA